METAVNAESLLVSAVVGETPLQDSTYALIVTSKSMVNGQRTEGDPGRTALAVLSGCQQSSH
jgi:hypothetical protein